MKTLNIVLSFLLELGLLFGLGYWGFQTHSDVAKWLFGVGAPLLAAVIWGIWIAPRAAGRLSDPFRLLLEVILFAASVLALWNAGQQHSALFFATVVGINLILTVVWDQRNPPDFTPSHKRG